MSNGDSGLSSIPILGPILDALGNIFGGQSQVQGLANAVSQVEKAAWQNTLELGAFAYGALGGILGSLGDLIKGVASALEKLFGDVIWGVIKKLFEALKNWILNLRNWIKLHVATLQQIQKNLDKARSQYFRKVIDIVQRIRKILVPFRLLHLGFAKKLDSYLVTLEGDIGAKWAKMIAHQNLVLGVLDTIIDPRNLLRPGSTLGSLGAMIAAVHGAIGAADVRTLFCMGPAVAAQPLVAPWSTTKAVTLQQVQTRSGDYAMYLAQRDQASQQIEIDLGLPHVTYK
jgi:hypothetical protein